MRLNHDREAKTFMSRKYVSKSEAFNFAIHGDVLGYVTDDAGNLKQRVTQEALICEFKPLISFGTAYDRAVATRTFFPQSAWRHSSSDDRSGHRLLGAIASQSPQGIFEPGPGDTQKLVGMTSAYDPTMHFGFFDSSWIPDETRRLEAEAGLANHGLNGIEYVEVVAEALPAPWPTYDKIGQGAVAKIPATVKDLGLDPYTVYAYEAATKNREGVLASLQKLADEQAEAIADEASLERVL